MNSKKGNNLGSTKKFFNYIMATKIDWIYNKFEREKKMFGEKKKRNNLLLVF